MKTFGHIMVFAFAIAQGYSDTINTKLGRFFKHEIDFVNFVSRGNVQNASVSFTVSQLGFPDRPEWIRLEQRKPTDPAFLYGSPPQGTTNTVKLEVTGWNKQTYDTKRAEIQITVDTSEDAPRYRVEFHIKDQYIYTFLKENKPDKFLEKVKRVWKLPDGGPYVSNIYAGVDRGERIPIPPQKESVYVEVGGSREYTVFEKEYTKCRGLKSSSNDQFNPFNIDWCKFSMRDVKKVNTEVSSDILQFGPAQEIFQSTYLPVAYDPSARDFGQKWLLVLVLPVIIALLIIIILATAMCFYREGRPKRDNQTPGYQLSHHDSILRATFRLRQMSKPNQNKEPSDNTSPGPDRTQPQPQHTSTPYSNRQTPRPDSEQDETDASQQFAASPPYRMPPAAGINVSSSDGSNQYRSPTQADKKERPPPFMSSQEMYGRH